jgi:hypothetical protein
MLVVMVKICCVSEEDHLKVMRMRDLKISGSDSGEYWRLEPSGGSMHL